MILLSLTPTLRQLVFKQKKMSLRSENSAWWKIALRQLKFGVNAVLVNYALFEF